MIHTVKGFSIVNETDVYVFLEFPCFLYDPVNVGNLISGSSAFSKRRWDIWKFLVHIRLKPSMQDFEQNLTRMGDEYNCPAVSTFFTTALLGNWDEYWFFLVLWPPLGFPNLLTSLSAALLTASSLRILNSFTGITSPPVALLEVVLVAQRLKRLSAMRETWVRSRVGKIPWRRKWQPTSVFLPGESHGQRSLVGYSSRGRKELDMTERLHSLNQCSLRPIHTLECLALDEWPYHHGYEGH